MLNNIISGFFYSFWVFLDNQEMWNERLKKYEEELNRKKIAEQSNEFQESL